MMAPTGSSLVSPRATSSPLTKVPLVDESVTSTRCPGDSSSRNVHWRPDTCPEIVKSAQPRAVRAGGVGHAGSSGG